MNRQAFLVSVLLAAASAAPFASAQELNPQPEPPGVHGLVRFPRETDALVYLPPGPCVRFGGRVGREGGLCRVPVVIFAPPAPCVRAGGRVVRTRAGRQACVRTGGEDRPR
jgi:hypothetical protein